MKHKALLWEKTNTNDVHCYLCAHNCKISNDNFGVCGMRQNVDGELFTFAYSNVIASHVDPIEKKPFYHFLPGTTSFSIATIGCNFKCGFCQNWTISQLSRRNGDIEGYELSPEEVVREALHSKCRSISYTYTEPTVFFEYAYDTAKIAKKEGLYNTFITNGYMTSDAIDLISPYLDAANVDLKFFNNKLYEKICGGSLTPVLEAIRKLKESGIWVEITTLVIPGQNDSEEELKEMAGFIKSVSEDIPWHLSRFHPDYRFKAVEDTPRETFQKALNIAKNEGLKHVYLGNISDETDTICPKCDNIVISRVGYSVKKEMQEEPGSMKCKKCGTNIAGVWE